MLPLPRLVAIVVLVAATGLVSPVAAAAEDPAAATDQAIDEATLVAMMDDVVRYYDESRPAEGRILELLQAYEKNKDSLEYKKLRFLFDTHQKVTTSLNNLIDLLYISLKHGNYEDKELNNYLYSRCKNIITFLNNMVYFLTARNQEMALGSSVDVQQLYEGYLVRLTTLLYDLNKLLAHFHK
ncbi:MAG: hypothetical protein ACP59X_20415 [Solidesulfovibrio sp. DCME]|uniref:hypothetical protein n=1 Tax=Solidesulfovibrio sp. DCME TaxID=3447380 RepID=UPI003D127660